MKKVIVISAHPDDEILGAGGTLLKHKKNGDKIYWLIVTNVLESYGFSKERICSRQKEIEKISEALGVEKVFLLNYPTMSLSTSTLIEMVPKISKVFTEIEPEIVYCLNRSDAHSDHRITFDAVMACTKSFRYPFIKQVLMYECISETEFAPQLPEKVFIPNYFVDISSFLEEKLELMKIYESEVGEHPFPRSLRNIEALATYRGASVGVEYAEAFQLIKYIDK
ncbi:PIG-L family deacetylase [uncultured Capnocytophaga sp.]|uniref:PIG-L deacetylase family protein n=1 Tax=uncultured Capnocytophaga sp. TaxID=159273 RepID=UPI0025928A4C|nr:PIG-L family deacetylase [uncultured Capnocytophaga sp.]